MLSLNLTVHEYGTPTIPVTSLESQYSCLSFPEGLRTPIVSFITHLYAGGRPSDFVLLLHTYFHFEGCFHIWYFLFLSVFFFFFSEFCFVLFTWAHFHMAGLFSCLV